MTTGDPLLDRLYWLVPDAEPLQQLLLSVKPEDPEGVQAAAIKAMKQRKLMPSVELAEWWCSRASFLVWIDETKGEGAWLLYK